MESAFLGVGWSFPVELDTEGRVAAAGYEEAIRRSIWVILSTSPGERVMRPAFGCGIHDLVFAVNDAGTAGRIGSEVREALVRWEPRIEATNVAASPDSKAPNVLLIEVEYRIRSTNNRFNLVYPFYLQS